jgi:arabinose-5-phosphate isomerase
MHTGRELPIVRQSSSFREMLLEMTSKRFGLALIVDDNGKLAGIFTDGDLRRTIENYQNPLGLTAGKIAVSNPKRISANELAATAVAIMEDFNITSLVITDDQNRPTGLIHLHDLLKAKVV